MALRIVAGCEAVSCLVTPGLKRTINVDVISYTAIIFERILVKVHYLLLINNLPEKALSFILI